MNLTDFINEIKSYNPDADLKLLRESYRYSEKKHEGQSRLSGDPFFVHCKETAQTLIEHRMDIPTICAGLLHDVLEDTQTPAEELRAHFGAEITGLVEGLTKILKIEFKGTEEQRQAENYRKMLLAMAGDVRVIVIKLADRLHNMRTLEHIEDENKRLKTATETRDIFAPLAHRLGMSRLKSDLEDLAFKYLEPIEYEEISNMVHEKKAEREEYMYKTAVLITDILRGTGIETQVFGRTKHFYSIYQKIHEKGTPFNNIYDLIAFRAIVQTVAECYAALGVINTKWTPMPDRLRDFINPPKMNGYQSLHTTVWIDRRHVEIQIRTHEMQWNAEIGIAAHFRYKEGAFVTDANEYPFSSLREIIEDIQELKNPNQFMQSVKQALFPDEVYVFTPKGGLKALSTGATPIDFAYSVHSDLGNTCVGATVNNAIVPLGYQLKTGDIINIITDPNAKPSSKWLRIAKTSRAKGRIRRFLREQERRESIELGTKLFEAELRKREVKPRAYLKSAKLLAIAQELQLVSIEELLAQIGYGKISAQHIANLLLAKVFEAELRKHHVYLKPEDLLDITKTLQVTSIKELLAEIKRGKTAVQQVAKLLLAKSKDKQAEVIPPKKREKTATDAIKIEGFRDILIRISKCCNPIPGDEVIGFITRGRGISIHKLGCHRVNGESARIVSVEWQPIEDITHPAEIMVESDDRTGLLSDIAGAIAQYNVNISKSSTNSDTTTALQHYTLDVMGTEQLQQVINEIRRVKSVRQVIRKGVVG